jgi:hypothetical protein
VLQLGNRVSILGDERVTVYKQNGGIDDSTDFNETHVT